MSTSLPKIAITSSYSTDTSSSSENDSTTNDMDYSRNNGQHTDVEDLDSEVVLPRSRKNSTNNKLSLPAKNPTADNDATDIEDYNDSDDEEEERSKVYPELKMSLEEFLRNGLQEQALIDNESKENVENKSGNFLEAQKLNFTTDYLTDCEDYNTDSEMDGPMEKSVCVDLDSAVDGPGKVSIKDGARAESQHDTDDENDAEEVDDDDGSVGSDISDIASIISDMADDAQGAQGGANVSVAELLEMSGDEEVCQIEYSGSSSSDEEHCQALVIKLTLKPLDVMFCSADGQLRKAPTTPTTNCKAFLDVKTNANEEVLTDIERLDDSAAEGEDSFDEEEDDKQPIPRAVILAPGDDGECHTDIDDINCDSSMSSSLDMSKAVACLYAIRADILPPVHREVVVLKEDKNGDTIANVMPMDSEFQFGMHSSVRDDLGTDTEDYSCAEDWNGAVVPDAQIAQGMIESEFTISSDTLKPVMTKRSEILSNAESVTDVEEIFLAGTNRRKKLKSKSASKGKSRLLEVKSAANEGGAVTDVEDIDLSESGLPPLAIRSDGGSKRQQQQNQQQQLDNDKVTDVEDVTDDGISDVSDTEAPQMDPNILNLTDYVSSGSNIEHSVEHDGSKKCNKRNTRNNLRIKVVRKMHINQEHTDSEDMQGTSDIDDGLDTSKDSNCSSSDLNEIYNESYTVVHEKTGSTFDVESEKLHIKGMPDFREAHTDVEFVESDEPLARGGN